MSEGLRYLDHTLQTRPSRGLPSRGLPSLVLIAVVGLVSPHAGSGQVIQGYVLEDSTRVEVAHASVSLLRSDSVLKVTSTDSEGWFSFTLSDPGTYNLKASRLGYETTTTSPISAGPSDILTVEFVLRAKPVPMEPIVVIAGRGRGSSRFYERMETWGKGIFMTPSMIDSINPRHPADVLRGQEETWLSWQQGRWTLVPRIRTYLGNGCVNYVLDGRRIDPDLWGPVWTESPLSWISGKDVIAVEFYRYVGEAPPELRRFARDCGLLVFWTSVGW